MVSYERVPIKGDKKLKNYKWILWFSIIGMLMSIALLGRFVGLYIQMSIHPEVCYNPACVKIGAEFLSSINEAVNPCDNFFEFSCGNMFKFSSVAQEITRNQLSDLKYQQILEVLNEPVSEDDPLFVKNSKIMFSSCVKQDSNDIDSILRDLYGWPIVDKHQWQESNFNWTKFDVLCQKMGILNGAFINFNFRGDNSILLIQLRAPELLGLSRNSWDHDIVSFDGKGSYELAIKMASLLGVPREEAELDLSAAIELGKELHNRTDWPSIQISIKELTEKYPQINWLEYINEMLPNHIKVDAHQTISVEIDYLDHLFKVIDTFPKMTQSNYAVSKILIDIWNNFLKDLEGKAELPQWKKCIDFINPIFYEAINFMYLRKFLRPDTDIKVTYIVQNVTYTVLEKIIRPKYPQCEVRSYPVVRILYSTIVPSYGKLYNEAANKHIINTELYGKNFIRNMFQTAKFARDHFMGVKEVFDNTAEVQNMGAHEMALAPFVFQDPMYINDSPNYIKYGSLGGFIGSITINNMCPWVQLDKTNFDMCIAEDYQKEMNNKTGNNQKWKAIRTTENQLGVESAYFAYKLAMKQGWEPKIVGLDYNNAKMFWISSARELCMNRFTGVVDSNSTVPFEYQFNRFYASIPSFSKDFNCPANSTMNPKNKCRK